MSIQLVDEGYARRDAVVSSFFRQEAAALADVCRVLAGRFARGGRILAFGTGAAATDAQHVSVEFVHPVIVGKKALPALALPNDIATQSGPNAQDPAGAFARQLAVIGRPDDIAMGMVHGGRADGSEAVRAALKEGAAIGMATLSLGGIDGPPESDYSFAVDADDPFIVQEVHETLYHVVWELVHVFFEHKGLLADRRAERSHDTGGSGWLYPFLAEAENDVRSVLDEVGASIVQKADDVNALRARSKDAPGLLETARLIAERVRAGGQVLALGNGGSATDAQDLVGDLMAPPPGLAPIPALALTNDAAVVTAVSNDVGFDNVFARQVIAHGSEGDIAIAISTSGSSRNVVVAMEEARRRGLLTVALAGYGGGRLAELCDRAHVVDADYIPRIQEAPATQYHLLRRLLG